MGCRDCDRTRECAMKGVTPAADERSASDINDPNRCKIRAK